MLEISSEDRLRITAASLSIGAGILHMVLSPYHFNMPWGLGLFFAAAILGQVWYGLLLFLQPWRYDETGGIAERGRGGSMYLLGAVGNSTVILVYILVAIENLASSGLVDSSPLAELALSSAQGFIYSCIIPLPQLGSEGSQALLVLGLLSKSLEASIIACLVLLIRHSRERTSTTG